MEEEGLSEADRHIILEYKKRVLSRPVWWRKSCETVVSGFSEFRKILINIFGNDIESVVQDEASNRVASNDQTGDLYRKFYNSPLLSEIEMSLDKLLRGHILPMLSKRCDTQEFWVQKIPTIRFHFPNNRALGDYKHSACAEVTEEIKKRDPFCWYHYVHPRGEPFDGGLHSDAWYLHPKNEINFICPITTANDTASIWAESAPLQQDYEPLFLNCDDIVMLEFNSCHHFNKINVENYSRVTLDFRVLPLSLKSNEEKVLKSMTREETFDDNGYYKYVNVSIA